MWPKLQYQTISGFSASGPPPPSPLPRKMSLSKQFFKVRNSQSHQQAEPDKNLCRKCLSLTNWGHGSSIFTSNLTQHWGHDSNTYSLVHTVLNMSLTFCFCGNNVFSFLETLTWKIFCAAFAIFKFILSWVKLWIKAYAVLDTVFFKKPRAVFADRFKEKSIPYKKQFLHLSWVNLTFCLFAF